MIETDQEFVPPPEAPVFEPTWEEFQDALGYINKIRPIAEKTGICRIRPPPDWQPPFAVDVDTFRFVPRVQRLNELEAQSRIKLNFLDSLAKFWELQGVPLKIPHVERKYLDLFTLQKIVREEGGYDVCCRERKWSKVVSRLGYTAGKNVGSTLRQHYEKVLYPYDLFQQGISVDAEAIKKEEEAAATAAAAAAAAKVKKENIDQESGEREGQESQEGGMRRSSRRMAPKEDLSLDPAVNSELRRLAFYGPGPKAAVADTDKLLKDEDEEEEQGKKKMTTRVKKPISYVDMYHCSVCGRGDGEDCMLLCDGCDEAFHTYCLLPPMTDIPKGDWRCPKCVAKECNKPKVAYGFQQSRKEHSLHTFGEMADQFKLDYFNMPVHMVPTSAVEREFWRLVNTIEEDVCVEYGADVHAIEMGSGFPTKATAELFPEDEEYIEHSWNLNNLPVQTASVLRHINADISGMKIPWNYVGMCFSSFCWHIEDHWSYSINYLHWGEPKTWYGVPGAKAELLEECMKKNAPELFEQSPDLLHQLTTIMNPNILMAYGVPVVRTNQCAGEFVITFPRSYHAGFNQGYNFAEAVNFAPADWLPMGRLCIEHYRLLRRQCVFSHEELVCKMAANPDRLELMMAAGVYKDMLLMVDAEKHWRKKLLDWGTVEAEREAFELLPDDERQCCHCKTTCFLSAVTCQCNTGKLACIQHAETLCSTCPPSSHLLRYRYTLDELPKMLHRLKVRAESFDNWAIKVKAAIEPDEKLDKKPELSALKELVTEAKDQKFPDSPLLQSLQDAVGEAEKCASVANQLVSAKVRTRCRQSGESKYVAKLSLDELQAFNDQMISLPCIIPEAKLIGDLLAKVVAFQEDAQDALNEETPNSSRLDQLMESGITLDVELPELPKLKQVLQQARWLDEVREALTDPAQVTLELMRKLIEAGVGLSPHPACEKAMAELQELLTISERWEEKARICLQARPRHVMATLEAIISEAKGIPAFLPNIMQLKDALKKAKEWTSKVDSVQTGEHFPYLDMLEGLVNKGRPIPVRLDQLPQLESQVAAAKSWRERTARTFLKKNSTYSLVEVLSPRSDIGVYQSGKNRRKKLKDGDKDKGAGGDGMGGWDTGKMEEQRDPTSMVAAFKAAEFQEMDSMRDLRCKNVDKHQKADLDVKYCVCRKGLSGFMLQCELCKDWFHSSCVPLPKSANLKNKPSVQAAVAAARELKFLCPLCLRSRRPRLETILSLLVSLQKLPVRLAEGEALQCLTERAMAWQDRARNALATDELASALAKLSMMSQRIVEQAAREKTEKIISAELMKAASNPELQGHLQVVHPPSVASSSTGMFMDSDSSLPNVPSMEEDTESEPETQSESEPAAPQQPMSMEHAYSTASKSSLSVDVSPRKQARKSPLLTREGSGLQHVLDLSEAARHQLEELMMEGDLLEVSLDETQHIWRILQACQPQGDPSNKILEFADVDIDFSKDRGDREEKRKKRKSDGSMMGAGMAGGLMGDQKPKKKKTKLGKDGKPIKDEKKKRKKMKKNKDGVAVEPKKKRKLLMDDDGADDLCAALKCIKPTGDINWVQCDRCEKWFHLLCIGLGEDEVSENEDYVCYTCKHPRPKPRQKLPGGITIPAAASAPSASATAATYDFHDEEEDAVMYPPPPPSQPPRPSVQSVHRGLPAMPRPPSQIAQPQPYRTQQQQPPMMHQRAPAAASGRMANIEDLLAAAESQFMVDQAQEQEISQQQHQVIDHSIEAEIIDDDDDDDETETVEV